MEPPTTPAPADRVRHCLRAAGFHLVGDAGEVLPGLRVTDVGGGVAAVRWTPSDDFAALAGRQWADHAPGGGPATGETMHHLVRTAVVGVLAEQGHTVVDDAGLDILVVAGRPADRARQPRFS
ncbi:hypothetical protein [Streptomyces capparidis]